MNINNLFGGILGFIIAMSFTFIFWTPVNSFIATIGDTSTELKIFLSVAWVSFITILGVIAPMNLATSDDSGNQ